LPFVIPESGNLTEIRVFFSAAAVSTSSVGAVPTIRIDFYKVDAAGTGRTLLGTRYVPVSPTGVGIYNNLGTASPQSVLFNMSDIAVAGGEMVGWEFVNESGTEKINAVSRLLTSVHFVASS